MGLRSKARLACVCAACGLVLCARAAAAQVLQGQPIVLGNGAVTLSGDFSASTGLDDPGFYNYTDYQSTDAAQELESADSSLRRVRAALSGRVKAGDHFSFLGELRIQSAGSSQIWDSRPEASALYVRIRPWVDRALDIQVGRIPPTFGAFGRRPYTSDNLLVGYPLGYQYLTSLRPDAIPANADELLRMRGRGWLSNFSVGNPIPQRGVPLAATFRWDTGIQIHGTTDMIDATASITTGTLANPLVKDDNSGRQIAGRVAVHPIVGLVVGASASRGPFFATNAVRAATTQDPDTFTQTAWGADAEYSRGYYLLRAETIVSRWTLPAVRAPFIDGPVRATSVSVEGRYKILPGLYAAARVDHLGFSTITGTAGPRTWDAPVDRLETGAGYYVQRNVLLKGSYQFDRRDTNRVPRSHLAGAEVVFWF